MDVFMGAATMGSGGGPIPKRTEERRRQNKPAIPLTTTTIAGPVRIPHGEADWHPLAKSLYRSFKHSGQVRYWEPSDWQTAKALAHLLSVELRKAKPSPAMVGVIFSGLGKLGITEGDRRRMSIEIERNTQPKLASVTVMDDYRDSFN